MKTQNVKLFWAWFLNHHEKLRALRSLLPKEQQHYTFWFGWHLQFYVPGLDYLLVFPNRNNEKVQLIITANGNPEHFEKVEAVIKFAPELHHWIFTAFVQPALNYEELENGLDKPYVFQDITLKASELKFSPLEYDGEKKIDMIVYLKNFTVYSQNKNLLQLIFIMMQDLLGEKVLYQHINFVQLAQLPINDSQALIHLYDLQLYLDQLSKSQ